MRIVAKGRAFEEEEARMAQTEAFPIGFKTSRWDRKRIDQDRKALDGPCVSMSPLETWRKRVRFRRHLWRLLRDKPELIEDIGLSVEIAQQESVKPFWRK
jgi:uncharacterized protein YjiS (DUF1127 family)